MARVEPPHLGLGQLQEVALGQVGERGVERAAEERGREGEAVGDALRGRARRGRGSPSDRNPSPRGMRTPNPRGGVLRALRLEGLEDDGEARVGEGAEARGRPREARSRGATATLCASSVETSVSAG